MELPQISKLLVFFFSPAATASMDKVALSSSQADSASGVPGITVDKSVEFSYEELFNATEGFSMSNKIGQGGFGAVYYAELRGEVSLNFSQLHR
jgi:hypothetical protein